MRHYACAILVADGRVLLGLRSPHRRAYAGKWDVIGGLVENGESMDEALRRELAEELGIVPVAWESLCTVADTGPQARGEATYHMHVVRSWSGGEPRLANDEHTALEWHAIEDACALADLALDAYRSMFRMMAARSV
ncbi:ADP-ribose pyrophosphatase YjhB (NUDIX family) [Stella humosa]|uniref:ADP-ribose pyrophosphatase YjhB (NUDIX family) n=1 Tax=Stella humosa TaxID=94 RepID=A0A3N1KR31_9PROT|nr:NUDIX domain-containing protein [Stella humosa]ROP84283.1 ADP-ribose pyrophosphatase YjhB (NUDIX family) [Stella humosa]BBK33796.1 hypothetical protein STHU_44300 [Stella humosa]